MPHPVDGTSNVVVQLGRYGDLLNIFPVLQEMEREGKRAKLVVGEKFASLLDGVSYVDRLNFKGEVGQIREAAKRAREKFKNVKVAQVWGDDWRAPRTTENFQRESWARLERDHRFEQLTLVLDRRDADRETQLVQSALAHFEDQTKPLLLVSLNAVSHPLPNPGKLRARLEKEFAGEFNILDISTVPVVRLYDLLGLMDRASCLITVDTASLHLANASAVPVVALVSSDSWTASLRRPNHIYRAPYNDVDVEQIVTAVRRTTIRNGRQKLVHVYSDFPVAEKDAARYAKARASWAAERAGFHGWVDCPVPDAAVRCSAKEIGDTRNLPFIKDLIEEGMKHTKIVSDIVILTNSDVGVTRGMTERLRRLCAVRGAAFGYRFDFDSVPEEGLDAVGVSRGKFLGGLDLFAFTRGFWEQHKDKFPDSVLGCAGWDLHYRDVVKSLRGGEIYGSHWHVLHPAPWQKLGPDNPGNAHNGRLYAKFRKSFDTTRPYSA